MKYARRVIAYHGCTREIADQLLAGDANLAASTNDWDWLGHGIYFWEFSHQRALDWARRKSNRPAVIGAVIQLTNCLDLLDIEHTKFLADFAADLVSACVALPINRGGRHDADCFVINQLCISMAEDGKPVDSVRSSFHEGNEILPGSGLRERSHIQIAVRNPTSILGYFKPNDRSTP